MNVPEGWPTEEMQLAGAQAIRIETTPINKLWTANKVFKEMLEAAPTPPAQDDASVDEIITRLYRRFKEWSKQGFGPEDVTWCEVKADVITLMREFTPPATEVALPDDFIGGVKRLVFIARTSGGTAGRDRDLCAALSRVEAMLEAIYDPDWQKGMRQGVAPEVEPVALHPDTAHLVDRFSKALAEKLARAEQKYGYSNGWMENGWLRECQRELVVHVRKGDPLDVAAYCAFLWHHGESTRLAADDGLRKAAEELNKFIHNGMHFDDDAYKTEMLRLVGNLDAELDKKS